MHSVPAVSVFSIRCLVTLTRLLVELRWRPICVSVPSERRPHASSLLLRLLLLGLCFPPRQLLLELALLLRLLLHDFPDLSSRPLRYRFLALLKHPPYLVFVSDERQVERRGAYDTSGSCSGESHQSLPICARPHVQILHRSASQV